MDKELSPELPEKEIPRKVWEHLLSSMDGNTPRGIMVEILRDDGAYVSASKVNDVLKVLKGLGLVECSWILRDGSPRWPCYRLTDRLHGLPGLAQTPEPTLPEIEPLSAACDCEARSNEYKGRDGWWHCFDCDRRTGKMDEAPSAFPGSPFGV
jgi:hypothetical protein